MRNFLNMQGKSYFVHQAAIVETNQIGKDTRVWAFVHILPGARIGENCNICDHCFIENDVVIGNNVTIKSGIYLWDGIRIEEDVFLGPNVVFTNDMRPRSKRYPEKVLTTWIKRGASIGANVTLTPGITIGKFAFVGAGSVVTKDIEDYALYFGNPARFKGFVCECGENLIFRGENSICKACGLRYKKMGERKVVRIK